MSRKFSSVYQKTRLLGSEYKLHVYYGSRTSQAVTDRADLVLHVIPLEEYLGSCNIFEAPATVTIGNYSIRHMLYIFYSSIADKTVLSRLWENLLVCHVVELCNLIGPTLPRCVTCQHVT